MIPPPPSALWGGLRVVVSPLLPMPPSHKEDARRIVRHGLAARTLSGMTVGVLEWLGEDVGPAPGVPTTALIIGDTLHTSAAIYEDLAGRSPNPPTARRP